jgi:hypothetical protein
VNIKKIIGMKMSERRQRNRLRPQFTDQIKRDNNETEDGR